MIQNISSISSQILQRQDAALTNTQSEKLSEVLSNYDAENLSDSDATEIVSQIDEIGITPGSALSTALSEAGIDARGLAQQAGISGAEGAGGPPGGGGPKGAGGPPPGGGQGRDSVDEAVVSLITEVVDSFSEDSDETLWETLEAALQAEGYDTSEPLINFTA